MSCYVCESCIQATELHHVVMRSRGGIAGPTVELCPSCHSSVHMSARSMVAGKSGDRYLDHYDHDQRCRALVLIKSIVLVESTKEDKRNPHPLLSVTLDHHSYHVALTLLQKDRGFSSRDKLINALCREIAAKYGLLDDVQEDKPGALVPLSAFKSIDRRRIK